MGLVTVVVLGLILTIPLTWFEGWTAVKMWQWFVLPVFTGLPTFTAWQAAGIMLCTHIIMPTHPDYFPNEDNDDKVERFVYSILYSPTRCLFCLGIGWLIKTFAL